MTIKKSPTDKKKTPTSQKGKGGPPIEAVIEAIQKSLTPDLLKPQFREGNKTNPFFGHCYHSAEALYHLIRDLKLPEEYRRYRPCRGVDENNISHWWLQNDDGDILDPTAGQYTSKGLVPPYAIGRRRMFLTAQSSSRACLVMGKILNSTRVETTSKQKKQPHVRKQQNERTKYGNLVVQSKNMLER